MLNFPALAALIIPIVNLDFKCPVNATSQVLGTTDYIFGPMIVNSVSSFKCAADIDGFQRSTIGVPRIQSNQTMSSVKNRFTKKWGLTLEAWITPNDIGSSNYLPIFTIGKQIDLAHSERPRDRCHDHDLRLSQYGPYIQLSYTAVGKCQSATIFSSPLASTLTHIVVSLSNTTTRVLINGKVASTRGISSFVDPHLENWNSTYGVQLFSDNVPAPLEVPNTSDKAFAGAIHNVKMYDFAVNDEDASILFQAGLRSDVLADSNGPVEPSSDLKQNVTGPPNNSRPARLTAKYSNIILKEGNTEKMPFTIGGDVYGLNVASVLVEIVSLPKYGKLSLNGITIKPGDRIPTDANFMASLTFGGLDEDFFNTANTTSDGIDLGIEIASFEFRLIEVNEGAITSTSATVRPLIQVVNVNDIPTLVVPQEIFLTGEKSAVHGRDVYVINGIHLDDSKDRNVDKVRVEVEVLGKSGDLQLNGEYLHLAEFSLCSLRSYSSWKCRGNGNGRIMTFVAEPGNVDLILSDMTFTPYDESSDDQIVVRVFDGEGGDCLDASEHKLYGNEQLSVHQRCTLTLGAIYIPEPSATKRLPGGADESDENKNFFENLWTQFFGALNNNWFMVGIIGMSIIVMIAVVLCCFLRHRARITLQQQKDTREGIDMA